MSGNLLTKPAFTYALKEEVKTDRNLPYVYLWSGNELGEVYKVKYILKKSENDKLKEQTNNKLKKISTFLQNIEKH